MKNNLWVLCLSQSLGRSCALCAQDGPLVVPARLGAQLTRTSHKAKATTPKCAQIQIKDCQKRPALCIKDFLVDWHHLSTFTPLPVAACMKVQSYFGERWIYKLRSLQAHSPFCGNTTSFTQLSQNAGSRFRPNPYHPLPKLFKAKQRLVTKI